MNSNLIGAGIGTLLALSAVVPTGNAPQPTAVGSNAASTTIKQGNLTISTVPGNPWVKVEDYHYTPRVPPAIDLSAWPQGLPVRAVVRDALGSCVGRITDESGQLQFIFVEADPPMCGGSLPGPRQQHQPIVEARG